MNYLKCIALGTLLTISTITIADNKSHSSTHLSILPYLDTEYYTISVNPNIKNTMIIIKDDNGEVYYKHRINESNEAQKLLDFSNLEDGEYSISLYAKDKKEIIKTFSIRAHKITNKESIGLHL